MREIFKIRRFGVLVIGLVIGLPAASTEPTTTEINTDGKNPNNVVTQSMGPDRKSYSPLKQINKSSVKKLVPVWNAALSNEQGEARRADGLQRRDVCDQRQVDVRHRRRNRPADLANAVTSSPASRAKPSRARRDDLQRQGLSRHRRQPPRRAST
jgi:hypothetical protein